jgi:hypothetical protein
VQGAINAALPSAVNRQSAAKVYTKPAVEPVFPLERTIKFQDIIKPDSSWAVCCSVLPVL